MSNGPARTTATHLMTTLAAAVAAAASWAAWLGWDQLRDVHPDGSVSGPYEAWQVIGLAVTLLVIGGAAAFKEWYVAAVLGTTAGVTAASFHDWSDDGSGLFVIGVGMIMIGTGVVATAVTAVIAAWHRRRGTGAPAAL
ncbi:hypothetical protein [Streptomyces tritici]|uniref:hypothetical protein n=1 Tax=Streptomyces tritici TaxID=2054410 RepID=UPI003AEFEC54